jgi:hypothetical protein
VLILLRTTLTTPLTYVDPVAASAARNRIAGEAAGTGDVLVAAHFPGMRFGRVIKTGGRRRFVAV